MSTIAYYKVSFSKANSIKNLMQEKNFETWDGAMNYMESQFKKLIELLSTKETDEDVISDAVWNNPYQDQLSYTRQIVVQNKKGFSRIFSGSVEKEWLYLN